MNTIQLEPSTLAKATSRAFGKDIYLLGTFKDGKKFWLEAPRWECGWYWGFGYIETYTNNDPKHAEDIDSHQHYNSLCFLKPEVYDYEKQAFVVKEYVHILSDHPDVAQCVLTKPEQWLLSDLMKTAYTLKQVAKLYRHGNSYLTSHEKTPLLKRPDREQEINEVELPAVFAAITELVKP